jgi:hypothetical protein
MSSVYWQCVKCLLAVCQVFIGSVSSVYCHLKIKKDNTRSNELSEMRYDYKILVVISEGKRPLSQF